MQKEQLFYRGRFFHSSPNHNVSVSVNNMPFLQKTKPNQKNLLMMHAFVGEWHNLFSESSIDRHLYCFLLFSFKDEDVLDIYTTVFSMYTSTLYIVLSITRYISTSAYNIL